MFSQQILSNKVVRYKLLLYPRHCCKGRSRNLVLGFFKESYSPLFSAYHQLFSALFGRNSTNALPQASLQFDISALFRTIVSYTATLTM